MMKANILTIEGKKKATIDLPICFSQEIREDIVAIVLEAKKTKQPLKVPKCKKKPSAP